MSFLATLRRTLTGAALLGAAAPSSACLVGDPQESPQIVITMAPPDCCYAQWGGTLAGTVTNVDTDAVIVVLYAQTDVYYVQPFVASTLAPSCGGVWSSGTHGGASYAAVLARESWSPPPLLAALPALGGDILAVATSPDSQRRLDFGGRTWIVKSSGGVPFGPGPNLWSDALENVWVDADGLHLRLVERNGSWTCAEVMSEAYLGYGRVRFEVDGPIDALDPAVVFAGFFYADQGTEVDIEWSRWGDPASPTNAQYVVQTMAAQPLALELGGTTSTHEIVWGPGGVDFATWGAGAPAPPLATWSHRASMPPPAFERLHFNLWLADGLSPQGGAMEVVVRSLETALPTDTALHGAPRARLQADTFAAGMSVRYSIELAHAANVWLRLFDPRGRLVGAAPAIALPAGRHTRVWEPGARLSHGLYFLRLDGAGPPLSTRVVVLR